jgi:simple sugar transport system ATP-binding protein
MDYAIEMLNIMKTYPGIVANDNVTMLVKKGEIHALLGENSSGKSTLIGILSGLIVPDAGTIKIDGRQAVLKNAADAGRLGIGTVYQDMKLVETMTVLENIFLGAEDTRFGFLYRKKTRTAISELIEKYGLDVDPDAAVKHLSAEMRQRVEILKALYRGNDIFIFDNPTQALTPVGAKNFVKILHALSAQGKTIIIVTSNIRDITGIADSCTVMKRGKSVASVKVSEVKPEELYALMAGEKSAKIPKKEAQADGSVLFEMQDVCFGMLKNVSLQVRSGEIVSVAVAKGNGQRELAKTAVGYSIPISGRIMIKGEDMTKADVRKKTACGIAYIPENRLRDGLVAENNLAVNFAMRHYRERPFSARGFLNLKKMKSYAESMIAAYNIPVYNGAQSLLGGMSGGNQQKIIIARELHTNPDIVIAVQPFKGLDNLSIEMLYKELNNLKMAQKGILMLSPDVEVITEISDRIYVMAEGSIVAEYDGASADAQKIGEQMSAQTQEAV